MSASGTLDVTREASTEGRLAHEVSYDEDLSLFALGTILLRNRWRIIRWMLAGGIVAAALTWSKPPKYEGVASFIPRSSGSPVGGLASIAGQFGLAIPTSDVSESPEFYVQLLSSRVVLTPIVRDTLLVPELGAEPVALLDVFEVEGETAAVREERGLELLRTIVRPTMDRTTGTVQVSVTTRWPSVSMAIVSAAIEGVNNFNQRTRQGQAAVEREFVEGRLQIAGSELREAEDRLASFLASNRQIEGSPQLLFERERLQRDVALDQQVFTTLRQAYEEARIREVRAIPVITVLEEPAVPVLAEPRGRLINTALGLVSGAVIGVILALTAEMMKRAWRTGGPDAAALHRTLQDIRRELFGWTRVFRRSA